MAASVAATAVRRGHDPASILRIRRAVELATEPRVEALPGDHHPAFLHPGRSALVLLHDVPTAPEDAIVLAALVESRDPGLRAADARVAAAFGGAISDTRAGVPAPGTEDLAERLVTLPGPVALAALAERLDHLRHEHIREPVTPWRELLEEVQAAWLPVATRTDGTLARRYAHWVRVFRRRL